MDILPQNAEPAGVTPAGRNTEEGARTLDLWIHNPVLYQLSYLGIEHRPKHFILRYPKSEAKTSPRMAGAERPNPRKLALRHPQVENKKAFRLYLNRMRNK